MISVLGVAEVFAEQHGEHAMAQNVRDARAAFREMEERAAIFREALGRIRDHKGHPGTPVANSVKKSAIARAAIHKAGLP